jgi:hypothetical protein
VLRRIKKWAAALVPLRVVDWRRRRRLERQIQQWDDEYSRKAEAASFGERMRIFQQWDYETGWVRAELGQLDRRVLRRRAEQRGIELPPDDDSSWVLHQETGTKYLNETARVRVRRAIKQDRRESIKWWVEVWAPILGALTGLIGALIGLLALWRAP